MPPNQNGQNDQNPLTPAESGNPPALGQPDSIQPQTVSPSGPPQPTQNVPPQTYQAPTPASPVAPQAGMVNTSDPTQPGYIPPAVPVNHSESLQVDDKAAGKNRKLRILVALIALLVFFTGGGYVVKDFLFSGSSISSADLRETTVSTVTFKYPKQWKEADEPGFLTTYVDSGESLDKSDQGMLVMKDSLGINYEDLTQEQRADIDSALRAEMTKPNLIDGDICKDATPVQVRDANQVHYTDSYHISYTCNEIAGRGIKGEIQAVIGLKGSEMHMIIIVAVDKTWDKSGEALGEILSSFRPAS